MRCMPNFEREFDIFASKHVCIEIFTSVIKIWMGNPSFGENNHNMVNL